MDFGKWWKLNKELYLKAGVSEDIAYTIWTAACDAACEKVREYYNNK